MLEFFTRARPSVGLSDLARLSGTNKATCFRLMGELVEHGLVEQVASSKEYRIGPAVLRLAALREATVPTREAALPILQALATATGETAHMSHLVSGRLIPLAFAYSSAHGMRVMMEDAEVLPFHATSSGLAVLAWLGPAEQTRILSAPLPARTSLTPVTPEAVRARLAAVRQTGLSTAVDTFETNVSSYAAPLFDAEGVVQGAIAVAAPALRMTDAARQLIPRHLIGAARQVTALWGGTIPPELLAQWSAIELQEQV